jgi:NitT/TauT family transport system ATP-binding protein
VPTKVVISGVSKRFGDLEVLRDINLEFADGEFVSILGPSGCGKTTLLRIIHGLVPPDAGEIRVDGKPVRAPGAERGFVFQADALLPWRTVERNVRIGMELNGQADAQGRERVRSLLRLVGLERFGSYYPRQLSGGMRQRANLARALAVDPDVLLMDEPFAALDAQTREIMQTELLRIWLASRKTVVFITHQIDEAVYLSDRVVVLGRLPGRVKDIVPIELPRPRDLSVKRSLPFVAYVDRIWRDIEGDVRQSVAEEVG